ncbi:hypothetical protein AA0488_2666 [Kozakia baliensis NRIC 0488]|uniref:Uncharacterized protein n=3 Tax=Acetobacteraceae TaxID=433 RepID=A0A511XJ60_9PROT|nr:hypothetical protein A0U89_15415 [Kozakia baliensis]GBR04280.1 hypothetical protein AA21952_1375 [Acetobacter oeni LMG 21952]GBR33126.1 hypothetical protein AA0488_2666 [Kozakia baliensis NRIC 0488]GEL65288.1 hypothetical protein KBA01_25740 [Kozakia baliensis]GEN62982.1 hypothetical protein AOE01nite_12060 [Acetobacter oeni]
MHDPFGVQRIPAKSGEDAELARAGFVSRFKRIDRRWFLSISATFAFIEDGLRPHQFSSPRS